MASQSKQQEAIKPFKTTIMRKCVRMTKAQHLKICTKKRESPGMSLKELVEWAKEEFSLLKPPVKTAIANVLANRNQLQSLSADCLTKKQRRPKRMLDLDSRLTELIIFCEQSNVAVSGCVIIQFAKRFAAELNHPSGRRVLYTRSGWPSFYCALRFPPQTCARRNRFCGSQRSVKMRWSAPRHDRSDHPADVFNMDENAFFYKCMLRWSYLLGSAPALKQDKVHLTVVVSTNANGTEKLPLLFLGKVKNPRWLSQKPDGVGYCDTSKGWITVPVFQKWLRDLNEEMRDADRRILLLLDNAPVHIEPQEPLSNVCVLKLPSNTTAANQPMDQDVIACLKRGVMSLKTDAAVDRLLDGFDDPYSVSLLDAIQWFQESWESVTSETIMNCWKHAGLFVDRLRLDCLLNTEN